MKDQPHELHDTIVHEKTSKFWSGDLGLTLVTISLVVLIFVIMPMERSGLPERMLLYLLIVTLMIFGALAVSQNPLATVLMIGTFVATALVLAVERFHSTYFLNQLGSVLVTVTLLIYIRIVLVVMFRRGPITWRRIQGGVCAYLLLGLVWGSAFEFIERMHPGSFSFVTAASNIDQLSSKLTYFSFSTLTTVGFGDVTPVLPFARSLTIAEAVVGQLFPAILIGALVAMAIQSRRNS
jgi:hypothetical protein